MLKTVVLLNIFVETVIHFLSSKEQPLKLKYFCNIVNVFTATFDQYKESSLITKYILTPNFWIAMYIK